MEDGIECGGGGGRGRSREERERERGVTLGGNLGVAGEGGEKIEDFFLPSSDPIQQHTKSGGEEAAFNFSPTPVPPPPICPRGGKMGQRKRRGGGRRQGGKYIWESLPRIDAPWNYENDPSLPHSYWCMGSGFWKEKKVFLIITLSRPLPPPIYTAAEYKVEGKGRLCTSRSWPWGLFSRIEEEAPTSFFC